MSKYFSLPVQSSFDGEDDFQSEDKSTFIRIRYEGTQVHTIEFLRGALKYQGIDLHSGTFLPDIEKFFSAKGFTLRRSKWLGDGKDCPELGINIATREDVGGDGEEIEWVILSSNFN